MYPENADGEVAGQGGKSAGILNTQVDQALLEIPLQRAF